MDTVTKRITELSPEKRALLVQQLAKKRGEAVASIHPQRRDTDRFPLSFAQQRLWFLEQLNPGTSVYNVSSALHLAGPLAPAALQRSLSAILRRHEALRTTFAEHDGTPFQLIGAAHAQLLPLLDLRGLPAAERTTTARELARIEAQRPFDLVAGPLLRTTLLRLDADEHVLLLTFHHIVFDGWSLGVFMDELTALYSAHTSARAARLPELPIQYADYALWQRQWLQSTVLTTQLGYWQRQLAGAPAVLELPLDRPRPPIQRFNGATLRFTMPDALGGALRRLSQREGLTLFMTTLAAFHTLLARYSGQSDIVIGTPVAGRSRTELEGLIGFFVNTLALRTASAGQPTFRELARRVRETCLDAYAHQDLPFERLVEELRLERDLSRAPLFQVLFDLHSASAQPPALPGLAMDWWEDQSGAGKYDLLLALEDGPALSGAIEYNADLFDATTIARMLEHLQTLLAGIVARPDQRIADLPLLTARERTQLLTEWNDTAAAYPHEQSVHELFAAQAARTPDAVALVFEEQRLSYAELNARANQLAAYLRTLGVGPDVRVGICLERSLELMLGVLGVLKAGGAYVPIDPALPPDRKAFMLEDSRAVALITTNDERRSASFMLRPSPFALQHVVDLAADWPRIACASRANPRSAVCPEHLVYTIYTSGSTGAPKAVAVAHRQLVNYVSAVLTRLDLPTGASYATVSTIAADLGNTAIFPALCGGGCLHIIAQERVLDAAMFADYFRRTPVDCLKIVPSHLAALLAGPGAQDILPRQCLVLGGEATNWELIERIGALAPACRIVNHYGPTETTVGVMAHELAQLDRRSSPVPLGDPLANMQIYLLDRHMQPAPIGVVGEVYIGGVQLARGYLNRPDLTAERFVPNPFRDCRLQIADCRLSQSTICNLQSAMGTRLYKTGDLARYRSDGLIEYLGRRDAQVKVRGYRIELGEITTALAACPIVREAAVLVREDAPGDSRLVAYVVPTNDADRDPSVVLRPSSFIPDLRAFLSERLPDYMLPSAFVLLDALPLTANGKLDHRALPAPDNARASDSAAVAPRTVVESQLAQIWQELLNIAPIGVTDNFFELGGHSLLAVRLMAQIRQQFSRDLPLSALFQGATIEQLALLLDRPADDRAWSPLVAIQPAGAQRPFFAVHPIGGNVLCYTDLARALGPDQPFYGLQAIDPAEAADQEVRVEDMAASYIAALRTIQPHGPYQLGGWSFGGLVAFEMAQQLRRQGQEVGVLALLDSSPPATFGTPDNITDAMALAVLAREEAAMLGTTFPVVIEDLQQLDPQAQLKLVIDEIKRANLDFDTDLEWVQRFLKGYKARQRAIQTYRAQIYPGRITFFKSTERDAEISKIQSLMGTDFSAPARGWEALSAEPVEIYPVPGYHNMLAFGSNAELIARILRIDFARIQTQ
jgi:amino acid adenylation domain-containing protein